MSGARINTLVVDFSVLSVRPEVAKVRTMLRGNAKFRIPVYVDSDAAMVRVHDLPSSLP